MDVVVQPSGFLLRGLNNASSPTEIHSSSQGQKPLEDENICRNLYSHRFLVVVVFISACPHQLVREQLIAVTQITLLGILRRLASLHPCIIQALLYCCIHALGVVHELHYQDEQGQEDATC